MDSLPPEAFLRISEYFDFSIDEEALESSAGDEQKVSEDLELVEKMLKAFKPLEFDRTDPNKAEEIRKRNKKMKKTSMQKAFAGNNEDEDNQRLMGLLKQSYKNQKNASRVMDQHMDLIDTMGKSDSIKDCEKH